MSLYPANTPYERPLSSHVRPPPERTPRQPFFACAEPIVPPTYGPTMLGGGGGGKFADCASAGAAMNVNARASHFDRLLVTTVLFDGREGCEPSKASSRVSCAPLYNRPMLSRAWPAEGATRVPYWVYQDAEVYREEQRRIFHGPTWNYLCLEAELAEPASFLTTFVGDMPVVVTRDPKGALHAFENRCAHRGALICMQARGRAERFNCIYHNWTYDHAGNLTNVAFRKGIAGKGGMAADAHPESQAPKKLRVSSLHGLVFGTLDEKTPSLEDYIGPEILPRLRRVLVKPLKVL